MSSGKVFYMKITMLGTGCALVTECYNTCFIIEDRDHLMLVDGGGGNAILKKIADAGYKITDIKNIFVTHKHMDHIMGIIWLVRAIAQSMNKGKYIGDAYIYGHEEVIELVRDISTKLLNKKEIVRMDDRIHLTVVSDGEKKMIDKREYTFFDIGSTKAKQFGFRYEMSNNEVLVCCGDEPYNECEREYAYQADWMMHEAFCLFSEADEFDPYEKHHSTVKDACELAEELGVKNLILYHTEDKNIANRKALYSEEGKAFYNGNLIIPDDMEVIEIERYRCE